MPLPSATAGSSVTREPAAGTSWIGPTTSWVRVYASPHRVGARLPRPGRPAAASFVYASIGIGTNSLARMPPPRMSSLWWRKSVVEIERPGPHRVLHDLVEDPDRAGVDVALQVAADLVVLVADVAGEEQPGGLDRAGAQNHVARPHREAPPGPRELRRRRRARPSRDQPRRGGAGEEVAAAGREARGMVVLWLPFLASAWQAKPAQVPQRMHAGRPP